MRSASSVRRCRDNFVHKASNQLVDNCDIIVFEKLDINNLIKNHNLAQAIIDATWGKLRIYTAYKVEKRGGRALVVNPNGTSQKCSGCGEVAKENPDLSVRLFGCHSCGLVIDRDLNAALNILNLGPEKAHAEEQPILVRQRISLLRRSKKSTDLFGDSSRFELCHHL